MKTKSEELFEEFLAANNTPFEKVEEVNEKGASRPDYLVRISDLKLMFEVKQLGDDEAADVTQLLSSWSSTPGSHIRQRINRSKRQIQFGANQGIPSILLIYNNTDPVSS